MNPLLNEEIEISIAGVRQLNEFINKVYGVDLGCYALTSYKRRIVKFMERNDIRSLDLFIKRLENKEVFNKFLSCQSVEVTEFFRDPALWRYFRDEILPAVAKNHDHIKIWIPGCSTGEEVASAVITLQEANLIKKAEIIATDITDEILKGVVNRKYPLSKYEYSAANYKRYNPEGDCEFSKYTITDKNSFTIPESLFDNVTFEKYNYFDDFKIRGVNIIICRNIFIYFSSQFQEKIFEKFTSKLAFNGYLIIGNKENIEWCSDIARYSLVNDSEKVFRKTSP